MKIGNLRYLFSFWTSIFSLMALFILMTLCLGVSEFWRALSEMVLKMVSTFWLSGIEEDVANDVMDRV